MTEKPSYEYLLLHYSELEKQKISDENFIAELMEENSHYQIVINTMETEIKKMRCH